jgi:flagellar motility protein MotE (MotC chaperone)
MAASAHAFDLLESIHKAVKLGYTKEQAEFQAKQIEELRSEIYENFNTLATKEDLKELKNTLKEDIKGLKSELKEDSKDLKNELKEILENQKKEMYSAVTIRVGSMLIAAVLVLPSILKLTSYI